MSLELKNPEKFLNIEYAEISTNHLFVKNFKFGHTSSWYAKTIQGAKMIFTKEYGKGSVWEKNIL